MTSRQRMGALLSLCLVMGASSACLGGLRPRPSTPEPTPPVVIEGRDDEFRATCAAVYLSELGRAIDASGAATCLERCRRGDTREDLVVWLQGTPEYAERQARLERERQEREERERREEEQRAKLRGRLKASGTRIVDAAGENFHAVFASGLTLLTKTPAQRAAFLDEVRFLGFNGVRTFGGRLSWAGQSPTSALQALPAVIQETASRGLYLQIAAITDSRDGGYDEIAHLRRVAALTAGAEHVLLEVANEPYHHTQSALVNDLPGLCARAWSALVGYPNLWALGAAINDYPVNGRYAGACGPISVSHISRGGTSADMLAAALGLREIARVTGKPVISSEPIGAGERAERGRTADVAFFGALAHRLRSLDVGGGVFHSEDGLHARPPGPTQRAAAAAYVAGSRRAPVPLPPFEPFDPCRQATTGKAVVECERSRYDHMSKPQLADLMRAIARTLNEKGIEGGGFGVLLKTGGNNCQGVACDIVCKGNGLTQQQWDVLEDEEGAQNPRFTAVTEMVIRTCEVVR